jgi:hypothetical protein
LLSSLSTSIPHRLYLLIRLSVVVAVERDGSEAKLRNPPLASRPLTTAALFKGSLEMTVTVYLGCVAANGGSPLYSAEPCSRRYVAEDMTSHTSPAGCFYPLHNRAERLGKAEDPPTTVRMLIFFRWLKEPY